jgi:F-type H+-transporting ATPase subunit c
MNKLNKIKYIGYSALALALMALPAMAQAGAEAGDNKFTVNAAKAIGAGIGFGIAAGFAGIGQGLVGRGATEGVARNPGSSGTVMVIMIIALALIESLVLFALLIVFAAIGTVSAE